MAKEETRAWLERTLTEGLRPSHLEVLDESAAHAGHKGSGGGGHYRVTVVSEVFRGLSPIARHRAVYALLGDAMQREIHALALSTRTPEEAS
ncbi:MAG: BolA family transcriptional regulator [Deltaproteobacteria bacterium]|nr:BolA family transcriptional regulator [Deltaproteobacteria bacterium]